MKKLLLLSTFYFLLIGQGKAQAPANDEPCNAQMLTVQNLGCEPTTTYTYANATHSSAYGVTYCNGLTSRDVWFKFTVPASGEATVSIATAGQSDMAIEVLTGSSCSGPLAITNQSTQGFPCLYIRFNTTDDNRTFKNLSPGSTVYLRVYRFDDANAASGAVKICVGDPSQLADEPCNAGFFPIEAADPLGQNCEPTQKFSFSGATLTPSIPNPECLFSGYYPLVRDVWFKVRVPASGKINIGIKADGDWVNNAWFIQSFTANACTGPFTSLGCTQWDGTSNNPLKFFATYTNLAPNSILYCRLVANSSAAQPDGQVKICVSSFNSTPSINNSTKVGIGIDTPFAKLDVVGTGIFRDNLTAGRDLEVRGNLILQGNLISKFSQNGSLKFSEDGGLKTSGSLIVDSLASGGLTIDSIMLRSRLGNRISLWGGLGSVAHYGIGVQSGVLQLYVPSGNDALVFGHGHSRVFTEAMRVRGANVGIGTATPNAPLQFSNSLVNRKVVLFDGNNNDHQYYGFGVNGAALRYQVDATGADHVFFAGTSNNSSIELMRIRGNGNVGIGAANPIYLLDINGRMRIRSGGSGGNSAGIWLNDNANTQQLGFIGVTNDNHLGFFSNTAGVGFGLTMNTNNGFVGIQVPVPQVPLHFATAIGKKISLYRGPSGDAGFGVWGNELRIHSDYNGADITFGYDNLVNGFTERFRVQANGNATLAGVLTQNSDETLKKNIEPIANASHLLQQLHGYRYQWKDENADAEKQLGLLAQEVQKVLPELVKEGENGKLGVNYSGLIPVLLEALKEQRSEIDQLKALVKQLINTRQ